MRPSRAILFWLAVTLLIALGLAPGLASLSALINAPPYASNIKWLIVALALTPYLPLILVLIALRRQPILAPASARALGVLAMIVGAIFTLASAVFSGAGIVITLVQGTTLTLAVSTTLQTQSWPHLTVKHRKVLIATMALPVLAALWSLATIPIISLSARTIAAGAPYCITSHFRPQTVTTLWGLRGFSFYTTASGFKDTSQDYFHGLLIVNGTAGRQVYNWSPRHLRFDHIARPQDFGVSITPECPVFPNQ
jgi:hypothetical protein